MPMPNEPSIADQRFQAAHHSGFFRRALSSLSSPQNGGDETLAQLDELVAQPLLPEVVDAHWQWRLARNEAPEAALRRFRNLMVLAMMERDVTQRASVAEICTAVTTVAEICIRHALRVAAAESAAAGRIPP